MNKYQKWGCSLNGQSTVLARQMIWNHTPSSPQVIERTQHLTRWLLEVSVQSTGTPDSSMYYQNMVMIVCTSDAIFDFYAPIAQWQSRSFVRIGLGALKRKRAFLRMLFACIYLYVQNCTHLSLSFLTSSIKSIASSTALFMAFDNSFVSNDLYGSSSQLAEPGLPI